MRNIQQINNKYHIIKVLFGIRINYGTYKTLKEAKKQKIILEKNNWIKNNKKYHYPNHKCHNKFK